MDNDAIFIKFRGLADECIRAIRTINMIIAYAFNRILHLETTNVHELSLTSEITCGHSRLILTLGLCLSALK